MIMYIRFHLHLNIYLQFSTIRCITSNITTVDFEILRVIDDLVNNWIKENLQTQN